MQIRNKVTLEQLETPGTKLDIGGLTLPCSLNPIIGSVGMYDVHGQWQSFGRYENFIKVERAGYIGQMYYYIPISTFKQIGIIGTSTSTSTSTSTKPKKPKIKDILNIFSFELTYMPDIIFPKVLEETDIKNEAVRYSMNNYIYHMRDKIDRLLPRGWTKLIDDDNLEIQTGKQKDFNKLIKEIKTIEKSLKEKHGLIPSSLVDIDVEGGCHMNFDLSVLKNHNPYLADDVVNNFKNLILQYPSVVWTFLAPNDNESSELHYFEDHDDYSKGDFFTTRSGGYGSTLNFYIEMRFFMMPRSHKELKLHYDFGKRILEYSLEQTYKNKEIKTNFNNDKKHLENYTLERSKNEVKDFCKLIGFNYQRIVEAGKFELLQDRFDYGKGYLT